MYSCLIFKLKYIYRYQHQKSSIVKALVMLWLELKQYVDQQKTNSEYFDNCWCCLNYFSIDGCTVRMCCFSFSYIKVNWISFGYGQKKKVEFEDGNIHFSLLSDNLETQNK